MRRTWIALAIAVAFHAGSGALLYVATTMPSLDIDFTVPIDVQLGVLDPKLIEAAQQTAPPEEEPDPPQTPPPTGAGISVDAGVRPPRDAGPPRDARVRRRRDAGERDGSADDDASAVLAGDGDAGADSDGGRPSLGTGLVEAPEGAYVSIRLNMQRLRTSAHVAEVRGLIAAIPDWNALLGGSGIDPFDMLDRLAMTSADLTRENLVLTGRHVQTRQAVEQVVEQYAVANGGSPEWRDVEGARVGRWANPDSTSRVIALLDEQHFVITRADALPRVLDVARAEQQPGEPRGASLVAMEDASSVRIRIENLARYIRGRAPREAIPRRADAELREVADGVVEATITGEYASERAMLVGQTFFSQQRDLFLGHPMIQLSGLAPLFAGIQFQPEGTRLLIRAVIGRQHVNTALIFGTNYLSELFRQQQQQPPPPP